MERPVSLSQKVSGPVSLRSSSHAASQQRPTPPSSMAWLLPFSTTWKKRGWRAQILQRIIVPGLADELAQAVRAEKGTVPFRREAEMPAVRSFGDMLADGLA